MAPIFFISALVSFYRFLCDGAQVRKSNGKYLLVVPWFGLIAFRLLRLPSARGITALLIHVLTLVSLTLIFSNTDQVTVNDLQTDAHSLR